MKLDRRGAKLVNVLLALAVLASAAAWRSPGREPFREPMVRFRVRGIYMYVVAKGLPSKHSFSVQTRQGKTGEDYLLGWTRSSQIGTVDDIFRVLDPAAFGPMLSVCLVDSVNGDMYCQITRQYQKDSDI